MKATQVAVAICRMIVLHVIPIPDVFVTVNGLIVPFVNPTRGVAVILRNAKHVIRHIIECRRGYFMANFAEKWPVKTISMDLTEDCTCRCSYCFCGEKTHAVMEKDTAFRTIDWLLDEKTSGDEKEFQVDLWGGEPLMQWDLAREVISYGNRRAESMGKRIKWNMTTNGVLFSERVAEDMLLSGTSFMLSLDGNKNSQDKSRPLAGGGSSYDVIMANLPNMRKVNPNLRVRATIAEKDA